MSINASLDALLADAITPDYHPTEERIKGGYIAAAVIAALSGAFLLGTALHQTRDEAVQNQLTRSALVSRVQAAEIGRSHV